MKKLIIIAAALLIGIQANAQLIFNGGYLHATENTTFTEKGLTGGDVTVSGSDMLDGFYAGAKYRIGLDSITEGLSLAPGANVSFLFGRHAQIDAADPLDNKAIMNQIALNVPLHIQYLFEITPDFKLEAWAGPTFQLGIYDRVIDNDDNPTMIYNQFKAIPATVLSRAMDARNRINLYLGLGLGFEVAELIHINVGYDFGVLNLSTNPNGKVTRGLLRIGLGYNF
ncbi:MAG: outer membrane beta-barrel protein [Bacteroidales bacterium]|nr:outer membrane beta-barrel protein [Bacteroidales bacterium]